MSATLAEVCALSSAVLPVVVSIVVDCHYLRTVVQPVTSSLPGLRSFGGVPCAEVRHTATAREVRRACLQLRRPSRAELAYCRHPVYN